MNPQEKTRQDALVPFCPRCLGSGDSSSWNEEVTEAMCSNCGSPDTIRIPRWAVESIRKQASWVGKRYYPHDEDVELSEERKSLLKLVKTFPKRTASRAQSPKTETEATEANSWEVRQETPDGHWECIYVRAGSEAEAIEASRDILTYYPEEAFQTGDEGSKP